MRPITPLRRLLTTLTATAAVALASTGAAVAVPAAVGVPASTAPFSPASGPGPVLALRPVAELSAERLATADLVAAAKWGTTAPIDDPAREQQVLDAVAARATELGADPDEIRTVFRDQIEANKTVQRGLFRRWTDHPDQAPVTRPDLAVVRQEINRVTGALVEALAATATDRDAPACRPELALAALLVHHEDRLDAPHTRALTRSLASVCR
ncbi:chorismate mutase [Streptomyces rishiriensis]|uniref:chorismate mutase n=1 Tax=Streptomyces rishiriensis TaxID=68264 RepID=UPI0037D75138